MGRKVRMFTTYRDGIHERRWHEWDEERLIGSLKRGTPSFNEGWRPFDMLTGREHHAPGEPQLLVFEADDLLVGVEHNAGRAPFFYRSLDHDELFFQFLGETTIESEVGTFHTEPGEMIHIPHGLAYRATGSPDSLRVTTAYHGKLGVTVDPSNPKIVRRWRVTRSPNHSIAAGANGKTTVAALPDGQVWEVMGHWRDEDPYWVVRDEAELRSTALPEGGAPIVVFRPFEYFEGITGKGGYRGPVVVQGSEEVYIDVYNTTGEQHAFHRNLGTDELWFQFAGWSHNDTEIGAAER